MICVFNTINFFLYYPTWLSFGYDEQSYLEESIFRVLQPAKSPVPPGFRGRRWKRGL